MKSADTVKTFPKTDEEWEALIAEAPEHIDDPECPYDPNDPVAVEAFWKNAVVVYEGGPDALRAALAAKRRAGQRGKQKAPTKQRTTVRLSPEVLAHFRATGKGWQTRMDAALREWIAQH
jgi:uncharacterized protein (DUF4415 family)